jgi:hypothetical protein
LDTDATFQLEMSWLNLLAVENMYAIEATDATFQSAMLWLNAVAP